MQKGNSCFYTVIAALVIGSFQTHQKYFEMIKDILLTAAACAHKKVLKVEN